MLKHTLVPLALALALTGCSVVSDAELQAAKDRFDADGDGHFPTDVLQFPGVYGDDCDDTDAAVYPGAAPACDGLTDANCDGLIDGDADADGFSAEACGGDDCDDTNAAIHPDATELCNGVDDNCNGDVDGDATDKPTLFRDADADTFGDLSTTLAVCEAAGYVTNSDDCDDTQAAVNPDATELCNGVDDNCNGDVDGDATDKPTLYADADADTFGDLDTTTVACQATGYVADSADCDDTDPAIHPGATLACDGVTDANCDGDVDNDADIDGFSATACGGDDCDDAANAVNPDATELCNDVDDNCDGDVDGDAIDKPTLYADADADTFGDASATLVACQAAGYVADSTDCDDDAAAVNPSATELCNDIDDNCDGDVDGDATDKPTLYRDADADTFGDLNNNTVACHATGYIADSTDCDDTNANVNPNGIELCNSVDDNCNGDVDGDATDKPTLFTDADGDTFGDNNSPVATCPATGFVTDNTDCDDTDADRFPGNLEIPLDGTDQSCDDLDVCHDLDCDDLPDIVAGDTYQTGDLRSYSGQLFWGSASTWGAYGPTRTWDAPSAYASADFDHDGYVDVVIGALANDSTLSSNTSATIVWGGGSAPLQTTTLPAPAVTDVCVGDLDNDGWDDLLLVSYSDGTGNGLTASSKLYWGSETGFSISVKASLDVPFATSCALADLDGDGDLDVAIGTERTATNFEGRIYAWRNGLDLAPGNRAFSPASNWYNPNNNAITVADLNGDGRDDLIAWSRGGGTGTSSNPALARTQIYYGLTTSALIGHATGEYKDLSSRGQLYGAVADLNKDGVLDIVVPSAGDGSEPQSYIYWGPDYNPTYLNVTGAIGAVVADIDGDTHLDVLFTTAPADPTQGSDAVIFWGDGTSDGFTQTTTLPATRPTFGATVVDLDHDGLLDVVLPGQGGTTATDGQMTESFTYVYWGEQPRTDLPHGIDPTQFTSRPSRARDLLVVGR